MIRTIFADLPTRVKGFTVLKDDYYTIVLNHNLTKEQNEITYLHELNHIKNGDFDKIDIQDIETLAHMEVRG